MDGLLLYLDANNAKSYSGAGTSWLDLSSNGNNFTSVGSPSFANGAFSIPDSNSVYFSADTPTNFRQGTSDFTISTWVKQNDSGYNIFVESRGSNLVGYFFVANFTSVGRLSFFSNPGGDQQVYTTSRSDLPVGVVQNLVVTARRTSNTIKFYVDGALWETKTDVHTSSISPSSGDIYRLGFDKGGATSNFNIYTYQHYSRELSAVEIKQNFDALRGRFGI
jgi:hypothetical protein